jgi:hypothetical protein
VAGLGKQRAQDGPPAEASLDRRGGAWPYIVISFGAGGTADHDLSLGEGLVTSTGFLRPANGNKPNLRLDGTSELAGKITAIPGGSHAESRR